MKTLQLFWILLLVSAATAQCPINSWCHTQAAQLPHDNGWNNLFWMPDAGQFALYADTPTAPSPWADAFWKYPLQTSVQSASVWLPLSQCGDTNLTAPIQNRTCLASAIGASDTAATFDFGGKPGTACSINVAIGTPAIPQTGTLWLEDEAVDFTSCDELNPSVLTGSCPAGSKQVRFNGLTRGTRQAAGYLAAYAHSAATDGNLACPGPFLNGEVDHPPSRHPGGMIAYDTLRGRLWLAMGYEESWGYQDLWWNGIRDASGWKKIPQYSNYPPFLPNDSGSAMVYDPDEDGLLKYGGSLLDPRTWAMPLSCPTSLYINGSACVQYKWFPIATGSGRGAPVADKTPRAVYDSSVHRMAVFGGQNGSNANLHIVQQYNPTTGSWCLSDLTQGGTNSTAAFCTGLPTVSGPVPTPQNSQPLNFPAWTFDSTRQLSSYYAGAGVVYQYSASLNSWVQFTVAGGPTILPSVVNGQSWAYDPIDDTYVFVQTGVAPRPADTDVFQLPGIALQ